MTTRPFLVMLLATALAAPACKSGSTGNESTDTLQTPPPAPQDVPTPAPQDSASTASLDQLPTDTAHLAVGGSAQVRHNDAPAPAPLPTGVQEYRPDPNWVDNTPDPDPTEAVQVDQEAQCLNMPQVLGMVQYPPSARSEGVRGRVYLKVLVDPRGKVKRYVVRRSPDARLTNALVQVLDQLRYRPAFRQGQPIKSWEEFSFTFQ